MRRLSFLVMGLFLVSACIEHRKESETGGEEKAAAEKQFIQEKNYSGLKIFTGKIPCADCAAIEQRLVLKGDTTGIYRLTEVYKDATEDGDAELVSTGEWILLKDGSKGQKRLKISQGHLGDSIRVSLYDFMPKKIVQRELDGEKIVNKYGYTLKLIRSVP